MDHKRTSSPARAQSEDGGDRIVPTTQLLLLNAAVFAVELSATSVFTYIPPMLLKAGFDERQMSWVIGAGPFVCLLAVPAIGAASDRCSSGRLGKRLPFVFALCFGALLSLVSIPYLDGIAMAAGDGATHSAAAAALAFFVVLLDFCNQACLTPCEAFLSDVTRGTSVRDRAFSFYSLLSSIGGCIGYAITAISWESTPVGAVFGDQDHCVFSLIVIIFVLAMVATLRTAMGFLQRDPNLSSASVMRLSFPANGQLSALSAAEGGAVITKGTDGSTSSPRPAAAAAAASLLLRQQRGVLLCQRLVSLCPFQNVLGVVRDLLQVPLVLRRLVCANFCAWASIMTFLLFYTDFVGEVSYQGSPHAPTGSEQRLAFDDGVRVGSGGLFLHAATSAIAAAVIERSQGSISLRAVYFGGLFVFSLTVASMVFVRNAMLLNTLAAVTGVAFAAITTVPFSLIGIYHECKEVFFLDVPVASRMTRGIGTDMATMDTAYFSSQVLLLSFMGYLVHVTGSAVTYMAVATVMSALACFFITRLVYTKQQMLSLMEK